MSDSVIRTSGLGVNFGGHAAIEDVTFEAETGDFVAILGPNGSGKSTLVKTILGIIRPTTGSVEVFGRHPDEIDPASVGYVPQIKTFDRTFPALSIELVVSGIRRRWPARISGEDRDQAEEALRGVGAVHLARRRIGTLSGGELQRVYLARGLVRRPRLVLLDEPATGIDVAGESDFYEVLDRYRSGRRLTILMVTHDWEAAFHHATHILLLRSRQLAYGPPQEALTDLSLREAFGHVGHPHEVYGRDSHD